LAYLLHPSSFFARLSRIVPDNDAPIERTKARFYRAQASKLADV
jgi:hypothetical protein